MLIIAKNEIWIKIISYKIKIIFSIKFEKSIKSRI